MLSHPYDGDGILASCSIAGGRAFFRSRFIRTEEFRLEAASQRIEFRGTFATQRAGGALANAFDLYIKNVSNTSVHLVGGALWSCFEGSQALRVDPETLHYESRVTLDPETPTGLPMSMGTTSADEIMTRSLRTLRSGRGVPEAHSQAGGYAMTAHLHRDSHTGRLCGFEYQMRPAKALSADMNTHLSIFELDPDDESTRVEQLSYCLPGFGFLHDFAITENYYVLWINSVTVDNLPYILGQACAANCVRDLKTPPKIHLIPRPGSAAEKRGESATVVEGNTGFVYHHCNAYEEGGSVVLDSIHYPCYPNVCADEADRDQSNPDAAFILKAQRSCISLADATFEHRPLFEHYMEMPSVSPRVYGRKHQYIFGYRTAYTPNSVSIAKADVNTGEMSVWDVDEANFCGEPIFVPRPGSTAEDDGWLLAHMLDTRTHESLVLILDALRLESGPVARLRLRTPMPHALHGEFTSEYFGPPLSSSV